MTPKYQQIKQTLLYRIKNGQFLPGDKFYSENELKQEFKVSSITVIKAVQELVNEGYLVRYQGKGTYVSKAKKGKLVKISDKEKYQNAKERTSVHFVKEITDQQIAKELGLSPDSSFYHILRVKYVNEKPVIVQHSYIIKEFIRKEWEQEPEKFSSIYERVREDFGINLFQADSTEIMEIAFPTPAMERELLQLEENEPTAFTCRKSYLFDGRVIEYIQSYKRWDYFSLEISPA